MKKLDQLFEGGSVLSPLENSVLEELWPDRSLRVREIYGSLRKKGKKMALTSVAVILDRLHERKLVCRRIEPARGGLRYIYHPRQNKDGFERSVIANSIDGLIKQFGTTAVTYFNERFGKKR